MCMNCFFSAFNSLLFVNPKQNTLLCVVHHAHLNTRTVVSLICMRISSDFNLKIITTCVDICELQILMNVLIFPISFISASGPSIALVWENMCFLFVAIVARCQSNFGSDALCVRDYMWESHIVRAFTVIELYHLWPHILRFWHPHNLFPCTILSKLLFYTIWIHRENHEKKRRE